MKYWKSYDYSIKTDQIYTWLKFNAQIFLIRLLVNVVKDN